MLQATITVQFGINCTATSSNLGLIALLRVVIIIQCNTFTPQIKGKCHCINVILHWLRNVNEIYALISVRISR